MAENDSVEQWRLALPEAERTIVEGLDDVTKAQASLATQDAERERLSNHIKSVNRYNSYVLKRSNRQRERIESVRKTLQSLVVELEDIERDRG